MTMYGLDYWQPWSWKLAGETREVTLPSPPTVHQVRLAALAVTDRRQGIGATPKLPDHPSYRVAVVAAQPLLNGSVFDNGTLLPSVRSLLLFGCFVLCSICAEWLCV